MERKRILLSGCGKMGFAHASALSKRGDVSLLFNSANRASAEIFAKTFGGGAVGSLESGLLEADALVLATPPNNRIAPISLARELGKPVLSEKPLCSEKSEIGKLAKIVEKGKAGFFLQIAENWAYKRTVRFACKLVLSGKIGELREISVVRGAKISSSGWRESYGALLEGGIHQIALISSFSGWARPVKVSADFGSERPERSSSISIDYGGDLKASLKYSWKQNMSGGTLVKGTLGRIFLDNWLLSATLLSKRGWGFFPLGVRDPYGIEAIHSDFLSCIGGKRKPFYNFKKAQIDLETVFRAYTAL